jgi:hypothetical protein
MSYLVQKEVAMALGLPAVNLLNINHYLSILLMYDAELNKYYCKSSKECMKATGCKQAYTPEIEERHKAKRLAIKTIDIKTCFKRKTNVD